MSKLAPIQFCGGSFAARSPNFSAQRSVNFKPALIDAKDGIPATIILEPTDGKRLFVDLNGGSIRGIYELNNTIYAVKDNTFYSINTNGVGTALGTLLTNTGLVNILDNTVQITIDDDLYGYTYNLSTNVFARITDANFPAKGVTNLTYFDGYMVGSVNNSREAIQANLLDATTWQSLAFVNELTYTDNTVAIVSDQSQLYLFGSKQGEVRFDAGDVPFAFDKVQNGIIQYGVRAKRTIKKLDNSLWMLASSADGQGLIVKLSGYTPLIVSDKPLNDLIASFGDVSDAFAYTTKSGHSQYYNITFPTQNRTFAIDAASGLYDVQTGVRTFRAFEKSSFGIGRDRANCSAYFNGKTVVGDAFSGKIYYESPDYLDEDGAIIERVRVGQHQRADNAMMFLYELIIDIETGVGTISGQGSAPLATLEISKDGGHTWISYGTASMGLMGEYRKQLKWRINTRARIFTFRLTMADPVRSFIIGAWARFNLGK